MYSIDDFENEVLKNLYIISFTTCKIANIVGKMCDLKKVVPYDKVFRFNKLN